MWQEVENRKADETRMEKIRRKRGEERKEETNNRRRKDNSKNSRRKEKRRGRFNRAKSDRRDSSMKIP